MKRQLLFQLSSAFISKHVPIMMD
uniref:Uncharacterized protein n=1 Tax=Arundo donax TaxID=35708 RepID=A0A0A9H810_ARUDO